jgi:hypothetical protein
MVRHARCGQIFPRQVIIQMSKIANQIEGSIRAARVFPFSDRIGWIIAVLAGMLILSAPAAHAGNISFVNIFGNIGFEQTGDGNTLSLNGTFFSADLNATSPDVYTSASVSYPGPDSPQALTQGLPADGDYHFQTVTLPNLAAMEAAYPFGTYTFQGVNGPNTDTATLEYTADDYPQSNPYLTGTDYSSLQGMDPSQAFTFHFSPYVTGSIDTAAYIFFSVYDETAGKSVFNQGFLPATTTSVLLPANTLAPGHQYDYELDYSNRDILPDQGDADFGPQLGFDTRTDGLFTTAAASAPEPGGAAMLAIAGLAGLLILKRRAKIAA